MTGQESPRAGGTRRAVLAALIYFACVFAAGMALGPPRVIWLEPWLGKTIAVLLEAPLLIIAMWFGARFATRAARMDGAWPAYLGVGLLALLVQQIADLAVGFGLRGMTLADQLAYLGSPPGVVYGVSLVVFALMPLIGMLSRRNPS